MDVNSIVALASNMEQRGTGLMKNLTSNRVGHDTGSFAIAAATPARPIKLPLLAEWQICRYQEVSHVLISCQS